VRPRKDRHPSTRGPWKCRATTMVRPWKCQAEPSAARARGGKTIASKDAAGHVNGPGANHRPARLSSSIISSSSMLGSPTSALAKSRCSAAMADRACPRVVARVRAAALRRPCFVRAAMHRAMPSGVRGPVLHPPCSRHRPFAMAGFRHGMPVRLAHARLLIRERPSLRPRHDATSAPQVDHERLEAPRRSVQRVNGLSWEYHLPTIILDRPSRPAGRAPRRRAIPGRHLSPAQGGAATGQARGSGGRGGVPPG
jgi:hypothetical protein